MSGNSPTRAPPTTTARSLEATDAARRRSGSRALLHAAIRDPRATARPGRRAEGSHLRHDDLDLHQAGYRASADGPFLDMALYDRFQRLVNAVFSAISENSCVFVMATVSFLTLANISSLERSEPVFSLCPHGTPIRRARYPGGPGRGAVSRTAPAVGTVTAETPLSAIAAIDGAARHDFRAGWRDDGRDDGCDAVRLKASACRSSRRSAARLRAWPADTLTGGRVRRLARPAAPRPPPPALAARPGRPRAAPVPRRRLRPVAAVAWRTRRPPPPEKPSPRPAAAYSSS